VVSVKFRREVLTGEILHPDREFESAPSTLELRWDPLTDHTSRVMTPSGLIPRSDFDLPALAAETEATCPFCPGRLEDLTPELPSGIWPEGRIREGRAVLFPNLLAYSKHGAVSVYSPEMHYLPLGRMTPRLVADNLAAQVAFDRAVMRADPGAQWAWIDANHMLPSGSSVFHPHLQGGVDHIPTNMQRLLAAVPAERFVAYVEKERDIGRRYLGSTGAVDWLASFAPLGPAELRAFLPAVASPAELSADQTEELGHGLSVALNFYAELGFESFNLAIYGAPPGTPGYPLNLRMVCRTNLGALYRSDVTHLERLQWEGAVDISPEDLAERAGDRFRR
jgi:UDPglucose--hexose-1-phosphate uridylyltransferase